MKFSRILLLLALPVYLISCGTQQKLPNYLENVVDTSGKGEVKIPELRIQKEDLLSIQIFSLATKEGIDALWNPLGGGSSTALGGTGSGGFLVDVNGNIEHPRLGVFHAEGLTKQELATQIKKKLTEPDTLLKDPSVIIRFLNYKITVLGQVGHEGVVNVPGERLTILEAVGLAGGITDYGKKNSVKIIRETNGKREIGIIDLTSKDLFESPYYNLMQNDMVIVEPTNQKARQADQALVAQRVGFTISIISAAAVIYSIINGTR